MSRMVSPWGRRSHLVILSLLENGLGAVVCLWVGFVGMLDWEFVGDLDCQREGGGGELLDWMGW